MPTDDNLKNLKKKKCAGNKPQKAWKNLYIVHFAKHMFNCITYVKVSSVQASYCKLDLDFSVH